MGALDLRLRPGVRVGVPCAERRRRSATPNGGTPGAPPGSSPRDRADKGKDWVEQALGWTVEIVRHPPKIRHV
jgi:hypothetical protein